MKLLSIARGLVALTAFSPLFGGQIALTFTGGAVFNDEPTVGWEFTTASPITVTALGFLDDIGVGFADAHQVAIWTAAGVLQGGATVPSGSAAALVSGFRYVPVSFVLSPGDYVIAGDKPTGTDAH